MSIHPVSPSDQTPVASRSRHSPSHYPPIKYQRLLRGWSQQDVADALSRLCEDDGKVGVGINEAMISRWERDVRHPGIFYQKYLCKLFGMNTEQLGLLR